MLEGERFVHVNSICEFCVTSDFVNSELAARNSVDWYIWAMSSRWCVKSWPGVDITRARNLQLFWFFQGYMPDDWANIIQTWFVDGHRQWMQDIALTATERHKAHVPETETFYT